MKRISSDESLRIAWEMLRAFERLSVPRDPWVRETKRAIREYNKRKSDRRIISNKGMDGFVELIELPERITTEESAEEYFECYERREAMPSMYDCTGQSFTNWWKTCKRRGRWYVYHSVGFDV